MAIKRAVVVGINDYHNWSPPDDPHLNDLDYCVSDAQSVQQLLINAFGFSPSEIKLYTTNDKDVKPTRRNILSGLNEMISKSEAGDVAFFYFSGHGTWERTKISKGAWYEGICPYDTPIISDWNFAKATTDKLEPSYVNFTVMLDCCHSGGMHETDKAQKSIQMSSEVLHEIAEEMNTLVPCGVCLPDISPLKNNVSKVCIGDKGMIDLDEDPDKTLVEQSKSTLIAACRFYELSWEDPGTKHGFLTKALLDTVNQSNFKIDYHDLIETLRPKINEYLKKYIHPDIPGVTQRPQLRGQQNRMEENFLEGWTQSK